MKGYPYVLIILLLFFPFVTGCSELFDITGTSDWMYDIQEPLASVCTSPAAKLAGSAGLDPDHCYQGVAVNLRDTELCKKINRAAPRSKCYLLIADKYSDPSVCSLMPANLESGDSYSQMECLQTVAIKMGDSSVCDEIGNRKINRMFIGEVSRDACKQHVASGDTGGRSI